VGISITRGSCDGVDLSNTRAAFAGDWPGNFSLGGGTARVYLDEAMSAEQRRELEAILTGQRGGIWEALAAAVSKMLPAKVARISLNAGDAPSFSVAGGGEMSLQRLRDESGNQTQLLNSPVGAAFGMPQSNLAVSSGRWSDPELRSWQGGGNGAVNRFAWRG
jgi:hypothetical protein